MELLIAITIGIVSGWIAGLITKGRNFGGIGDLLVGITGAIVGSFIFLTLNINVNSIIGTIVLSVIGAVLFLAIISLFKRV